MGALFLAFLILFSTVMFLRSELNNKNGAKRVNFASICESPLFSSALNGSLWSPDYPNVYPNDLNCVYYINITQWLYYDLEFNIPVINVEGTMGNAFDWLTIEYESNQTWTPLVYRLTGKQNNLKYKASSAKFRLTFHTDDSNSQLTGPAPYGFTLNWDSKFKVPISPPKTASCAAPSIFFVLDRSEAIFENFYNQDIKFFIGKLTAHFAFVDDKTVLNPYHSRFGVIEFSDDAAVSVPLGDYTRKDFLSKVSKNVGYGSGGLSNVASALQVAYDQFVIQDESKSGPFAIILVINDISMFRFNKTLEAMNHLKTIVPLPMGVIVPGLSGIPANAKKHLTALLGNEKYGFDSLNDSVSGIPSLINSTFSCSVCSGIIFICETTEGVTWDLKLAYLQLVQRLAASTERSPKQLYGIALYGTELYQHIKMQPFKDFNQTLTAIINNMNDNDLPDGGNTYLAPILTELYTTLTTNLSSSHYATLIMGQVTSIKDPAPANIAANKIAGLSSDIYVLDETHFTYPTIWHTITKDKPSHIINGSLLSNPDDLFSTLKSTFLKYVNNMLC